MTNHLKILHLEDSLSDALLINLALRKSNLEYERLVVDTRDEFISALKDFSPDIILSDHSLPSFNSHEALNILKESGIKIPFILITANISEEFAVDVIKRGADDYVLKDRLKRLPTAIANAIEKFRLEKEQQKFLDKLIKNEKHYRALIENIHDAIILVDEKAILVYQSPSTEHITGFSLREMKNKIVFDQVHPDDKTDCLELFQQVSKKPGIASTNQFRIQHKSGEYIWIEGTIINLLHDESVKAFIINYRDITHRIEMWGQLRESEKRYFNLFHLSPQPMWVYDTVTMKFVQANKAAIELYGYSEAEFLAMSAKTIRLTEEEIKTEGSEKKDTSITEEKFEGQYKHVKKNGEVIDVELYSTPIIINDKAYKSVIAIDITEKLLYEYKITRAIIKTQEDERYEIGSELHDNVCQILVSSLLTLGMVERPLNTSGIDMYDRTKKYIRLATEEIRNLSHRLAPAFFNDSTLKQAFEMLLQSFNIENKFKISLFFDDGIKTSVIDREIQLNLYRILQEQLNNVYKYAKATTINVEVVMHLDRIKIRVSDNGIGFNVDTVKKGIGLANMKRRAELYFGTLLINSSPGNGTEVIVEVPLQQGSL